MPLADLIRKHKIPFHLYADDSQKYAIFQFGDYAGTVSKLEGLARDIKVWFHVNNLKSNDSKTKVFLISSKHKPIQSNDMIPLSVGNRLIQPSEYVRNLGVSMDNHLTFEKHVNNVVRSAFLKIREISFYRPYLTKEAARTLVHAYVTNRIDYCNSLLYGLPDYLIKKLQSVLNTAARVVMLKRKYDNISPVLYELHWLPVKFRIQYKLLLIVFKALNGLAPQYLKSRLSYREAGASVELRSSSSKLLNVWNNLPRALRMCESLEVFKRLLKTHLFRSAFPSIDIA